MPLAVSLCPEEAVRLNCYVDDPELLLLGATETNELNAVIVLIAWMAMGFKLAFH